MAIYASVRWHGWPQDSASIAGVLAFIVSVGNLVAVWLRRRKADVTARLESYTPPTGSRDEQTHAWLSGATFERIVVKNYGPAAAREVELLLDATEPGVVARLGEYVFPVPRLRAGQEIHDQIIRSGAQYPPRSVTLRWRDGRRGRQDVVVWLSMQKIV